MIPTKYTSIFRHISVFIGPPTAEEISQKKIIKKHWNSLKAPHRKSSQKMKNARKKALTNRAAFDAGFDSWLELESLVAEFRCKADLKKRNLIVAKLKAIKQRLEPGRKIAAIPRQSEVVNAAREIIVQNNGVPKNISNFIKEIANGIQQKRQQENKKRGEEQNRLKLMAENKTNCEAPQPETAKVQDQLVDLNYDARTIRTILRDRLDITGKRGRKPA